MFITAKGTIQDINCTGEGINVIDLIMLFCWKTVEMSGVLRWKKNIECSEFNELFHESSVDMAETNADDGGLPGL